jgi:hypothetical protein
LRPLAIAIALAGMLLGTAAAHGRDVRLRAAASLHAAGAGSATGPIVRLRWRDRSRGESRWEVWRGGRRRAVLKADSTRWTDRHVRVGTRYGYRVRPCRRSRCAKSRTVRITVRRATAAPGTGTAGGTPGTGAPGADPFAGSPTMGGCPIFPKDNPWNTDVSGYPVDRAQSDAYVGSLGAITLWPDFGSGQYGDFGIPYGVVAPDQPLVPISFHVSPPIAAESDPGPYPIPPTARVEVGGDHHVLILRQGDCRLFELYDATRQPDNSWSVYSAATFDLRSNALRHDGFTSADAAGLPMLPGLARVDEVRAGVIDHALRIAIPSTQNAYIHPATHAASSSTNPALPPMGLRVRLRPGYDISGLHGQARVIARALQVYGALVADNSGGAKVFISGTPDPGWDDDDLNQLKGIPASALEAVVTGPVHPG